MPVSPSEPLQINLCKPYIYLPVKVTQSGSYQFIFNEVTHNLVVEVLDRCPLDALLNILFLGEKLEDATRK